MSKSKSETTLPESSTPESTPTTAESASTEPSNPQKPGLGEVLVQSLKEALEMAMAQGADIGKTHTVAVPQEEGAPKEAGETTELPDEVEEEEVVQDLPPVDGAETTDARVWGFDKLYSVDSWSDMDNLYQDVWSSGGDEYATIPEKIEEQVFAMRVEHTMQGDEGSPLIPQFRFKWNQMRNEFRKTELEANLGISSKLPSTPKRLMGTSDELNAAVARSHDQFNLFTFHGRERTAIYLLCHTALPLSMLRDMILKYANNLKWTPTGKGMKNVSAFDRHGTVEVFRDGALRPEYPLVDSPDLNLGKTLSPVNPTGLAQSIADQLSEEGKAKQEAELIKEAAERNTEPRGTTSPELYPDPASINAVLNKLAGTLERIEQKFHDAEVAAELKKSQQAAIRNAKNPRKALGGPGASPGAPSRRTIIESFWKNGMGRGVPVPPGLNIPGWMGSAKEPKEGPTSGSRKLVVLEDVNVSQIGKEFYVQFVVESATEVYTEVESKLVGRMTRTLGYKHTEIKSWEFVENPRDEDGLGDVTLFLKGDRMYRFSCTPNEFKLDVLPCLTDPKRVLRLERLTRGE